ncbi:MAG: pitrilysin family protein, partial [Bacteroidales bacterium]|nr:pitrilysin family protein [Bacteroidales bacterium]
MNINRKIQPKFELIDKIKLTKADFIKLDNNIPVTVINAGTQEVLKIDFLFSAGEWLQKKALVANVTSEMLKEGTLKYSSLQISEKLDFYGAFLNQSVSKDTVQITLFTLKKFLVETIDVFEEIIKTPSFPDQEFEKFIKKSKQHFQIEQSKVSNLAKEKFFEQIFGAENPYGKAVKLSDFDKLNTDDLKRFYAKYYKANNCKIIVSGKVNSKDLKIINTSFGKKDWLIKEKNELPNYKLSQASSDIIIVNKKDAVQSAIFIGKKTINKRHDDYNKLQVVNTILGGYFGSRLMKTLREEKGYTYGISSILMSFQKSGMFAIVSEVDAENSKNAVDDIVTEINKLRNDLVPIEELNIVKNYLLGSVLRMFDGPFAISAAYKSLIEFNLDIEYYEKAINSIKSISSEEIRDIANKYLNEQDMVKVVAGK